MAENPRHMASTLVVGLAFLAFGIAVTPAWGAPEGPERPAVPPGNAQIDQYSESIPADSGMREISRNPDRNASGIGPSTVKELEELGPAGTAAAELALGNASRQERDAAPRAGGGRGDGEHRSFASGLSQALGGTPGGGSMGILLPLLAGLTLAAGIVFFAWRLWRKQGLGADDA